MARRKLIYEGKAKILYEGPEPGTLVQYFKDDATANNAEKKAVIDGIRHRKQPVLRNPSVSVVAAVIASDAEKSCAPRENFPEIEPFQPSSWTGAVRHGGISILAPHQEGSFHAAGNAQGFPHPRSLPSM